MSAKSSDVFSDILVKAMEYIESGKQEFLLANKLAYEKLSDYMTDLEIESSYSALCSILNIKY